MTAVESERTHEPLTDQFMGVELSVEDAFRTIISAGIVSPDEREPTSNRSFASLLAQLRAPQLS